jgi:DNA-binding response OmpR family regulator
MAARILVVDDEPSVLAVVSRALRDEGHEVIAVSNGQTAYDVTLNETVDVIVTNNRMPGLNGGELVSALRKHLPGIPILHLDELSQATHSLSQLPADVPTLLKPFDLVALKAAVHRLLRPPPPTQPGFATAL